MTICGKLRKTFIKVVIHYSMDFQLCIVLSGSKLGKVCSNVMDKTDDLLMCNNIDASFVLDNAFKPVVCSSECLSVHVNDVMCSVCFNVYVTSPSSYVCK